MFMLYYVIFEFVLWLIYQESQRSNGVLLLTVLIHCVSFCLVVLIFLVLLYLGDVHPSIKMMEDLQGADICRVCRSEGLPDRPLFHPCICTGSIKWIHQECLVQWMRYSRKEYCELCGHRFSFTPIYSPDMPRRLPLRDVAGGLLSSVATAVKYWLHYTLVALAWLGVVPLTACRIYRCLFSGSVDSVSKSICVLFGLESWGLSTGNTDF